MSLLIKSGRVVNEASGLDKVTDILINDGAIKEIGTNLEKKADEVIDASGLVVSMGFIDIHVHLREPGFEYKETIRTGSKAAIAGGITSLLCMPNTKPVIDDPSLLEFIAEEQAKCGLVDIYPVAALTKKSAGQEISEMYHLAQAGAVAFSDDGNNVDNGQVMRRALEYSSFVDKPVLVHAEDSNLANNGVVNECFTSTKLGLSTIASIAEETIIFRDISLVRLTGARVHFMHVSTAASIDLIRDAKKEGLPITCEVTPHHLLLDDTQLTDFDSNLKVKPPLRSKEDRVELLKGLRDGTIDCIASDHAPHALHEKEIEFDYAAFGMVGLETLFNLVFTNFTEELGLAKLLTKLTTNPAEIFNLETTALNERSKADITIFDPNGEVEVNSKNFFSKSKNTPFNGWKLKGKIKYVIKNGKIVFKNGKIVSKV